MAVKNLRRRIWKAAKSLSRLDTCSALLAGTAAAFEHEALLRTLRARTVVDVGANRGQFSLLARRCWPDCRIFAFEPLANPCRVFRIVLGRHHGVTLFPNAIGSSRQGAPMHVSGCDDSSSLLPIGQGQRSYAPGTEEVREEMVQIGRLVDFVRLEEIEAPAFLKIDVQGYEDKVIDGCTDLLPAFEYVYCELSFTELYEGQALACDVIRRMQSLGFEIRLVNNLALDSFGVPVQADFLFSKSDKP